MLGRGGLFRQENMEKRKVMSVREWAELCAKDDFRAPGVGEVGLRSRGANAKPGVRKSKKKPNPVKPESVDSRLGSTVVKQEPVDDAQPMVFGDAGSNYNPIVVNAVATPISPASEGAGAAPAETEKTSGRHKARKRVVPKREAKEAELAERTLQDTAFLETFKPHEDWLPPGTKATDYTRDFCQDLERKYWRNCGLGKPAWYGADTQGELILFGGESCVDQLAVQRFIIHRRHDFLECRPPPFNSFTYPTIF